MIESGSGRESFDSFGGLVGMESSMKADGERVVVGSGLCRGCAGELCAGSSCMTPPLISAAFWEVRVKCE